MGTLIGGKGHTSPLTGSEKVPLSPDGFATTQEVADLGTGGGQTLVIANDEDVTVAASPGTTIVLYTALTAPRVVNLPPASSASMTVTVKDVNGQVTDDNTVTIVASGGDSIIGNEQLFPPLGGGSALRAMTSLTNDGTTHWADVGESNLVGYLTYFTATALQSQLQTLGLNSGALPFADPHVVGQFWNNAGVVNVSAG